MFCPKCGTNLVDGAKFCANCGTKMNIVDATANFQPEQPNYPQNQNFNAPASPVKQNNKILIIAGSIIGGAILVAALAIGIVALVTSSDDNTPGNLSSLSGNHSVFNEVIDEYNTVLLQSKSFDYTNEQGSDAGNRVTHQIYEGLKKNGFNYLPVAGELPTKYAFVDMNDDNQDELVVFGQCCILSVYSYNPENCEISFKEDFHGHKGNYDHHHSCYDRISKDGIILYCYCPYFTANTACFYVLKMENTEFKEIENLEIGYGSEVSTRKHLDGSVSTSSDRNVYHNEIKTLEQTYANDESIEWIDFDCNNVKDAPSVNEWYFGGKTTYTGTLKYYTEEEAALNNGMTAEQFKTYKRGSLSDNGFYILVLDSPIVIHGRNGDGVGFRDVEVSTICLQTRDRRTVDKAGEYCIDEDCYHYKEKKCMISAEEFQFPSQYYGVPIGVFAENFKIKTAE